MQRPRRRALVRPGTILRRRCSRRGGVSPNLGPQRSPRSPKKRVRRPLRRRPPVPRPRSQRQSRPLRRALPAPRALSEPKQLQTQRLLPPARLLPAQGPLPVPKLPRAPRALLRRQPPGNILRRRNRRARLGPQRSPNRLRSPNKLRSPNRLRRRLQRQRALVRPQAQLRKPPGRGQLSQRSPLQGQRRPLQTSLRLNPPTTCWKHIQVSIRLRVPPHSTSQVGTTMTLRILRT